VRKKPACANRSVVINWNTDFRLTCRLALQRNRESGIQGIVPMQAVARTDEPERVE
jgi:hypothetical protein